MSAPQNHFPLETLPQNSNPKVLFFPSTDEKKHRRERKSLCKTTSSLSIIDFSWLVVTIHSLKYDAIKRKQKIASWKERRRVSAREKGEKIHPKIKPNFHKHKLSARYKNILGFSFSNLQPPYNAPNEHRQFFSAMCILRYFFFVYFHTFSRRSGNYTNTNDDRKKNRKKSSYKRQQKLRHPLLHPRSAVTFFFFFASNRIKNWI